MNYFQDTHSKFMDDWMEQFNWLKVLSDKYPKLKFVLKEENMMVEMKKKSL